MKRNVVSILETSTVREAAAVFAEHHTGRPPIVDTSSKLVGKIGSHDRLSLERPDFINGVADVDFVHDFGSVETTRPTAEVLDRPVTTWTRTHALMLQHDLHDMQVVSADGTLAGVLSRVDIGTAILSEWAQVS